MKFSSSTEFFFSPIIEIAFSLQHWDCKTHIDKDVVCSVQFAQIAVNNFLWKMFSHNHNTLNRNAKWKKNSIACKLFQSMNIMWVNRTKLEKSFVRSSFHDYVPTKSAAIKKWKCEITKNCLCQSLLTKTGTFSLISPIVEFIDVGKPARALDTLQEVFRNKKWTYTWSESVIEPIMFKYLDLCVELKKSHIAKEGLFQYRNMFQLVNVGSLENVIRGYLKMAEDRTEAAQQQSSQAVLDIDDLDDLATPESILMSAVCGEDAQDRSDRTILLPWVKFLWESYCQCLELLRVNTHCEALYHDIARMAFSFCLKYNRKMEFRKLCEKLRKHLEDICKVSLQTTGVSISKPETQQLNLDTR